MHKCRFQKCLIERCVKDVTATFSHVCSSENRDGFIRTRIRDRKKFPFLTTKHSSGHKLTNEEYDEGLKTFNPDL